MEGTDVTPVVRLRELARHLDWYSARLVFRNLDYPAQKAANLARDVREEADRMEREDGEPHA
jgi:hypothetical protein